MIIKQEKKLGREERNAAVVSQIKAIILGEDLASGVTIYYDNTRVSYDNKNGAWLEEKGHLASNYMPIANDEGISIVMEGSLLDVFRSQCWCYDEIVSVFRLYDFEYDFANGYSINLYYQEGSFEEIQKSYAKELEDMVSDFAKNNDLDDGGEDQFDIVYADEDCPLSGMQIIFDKEINSEFKSQLFDHWKVLWNKYSDSFSFNHGYELSIV